MYMRLVHLWSARAKHTVIIRIPSHPTRRLGLPRIFLTAPHAATALGLHNSQGEQCLHSAKLATSSYRVVKVSDTRCIDFLSSTQDAS
jgi:hypothetical protein